MEFITSLFATSFHGQGSGKVKDSHNSGTRAQILSNVRPAVTICRLFGVFPCTFTTIGDSLTLKHNRKKWFAYSLLCFLVSSAYMFFQGISFLIALNYSPVLSLAAQSLWFLCGMPAYCFTIFMFLRGKSLVQLFEDWCTIEQDLERLFCPIITARHIRRFQMLYFVMAILSTLFCAYHAIMSPRAAMYPFHYLDENLYNETHHVAYVIFQIIMILWLWAGLTMLEGTCCLFATVIGQCMTTLTTGLDYTFSGGKIDTKIGDSDINTSSMNQIHERFIKTAIHNMLNKNKASYSPEADHVDAGNAKNVPESSDHGIDITNDHKENCLLFVVKKVQTVGLLQSKINRILGPLLLMEVGNLVTITCILCFLPIRYASQIGSSEAIIVFAGNGVCVFVRLVVFLVCLGDVYSKGLDVNVALAKAMTSSSLSTASQNPVLGYLSVYSSNPITFTAWDFFAITKGTLLAAFSLISTYAVVFFQLKL